MLFFSAGIRANTQESRIAWLLWITCLLCGLSCFAIIYQGYKYEYPSDNMFWIFFGHSVVVACGGLLRFFPSALWPSRILMVCSIAQIFNAIFWSGGTSSAVISVLPVIPVFFAFLLSRLEVILSFLVICFGVMGLYFLGEHVVFPSFPDSLDLKKAVLLWSLFTGFVVAFYSKYQYETFNLSLKRELIEKQRAQSALLKGQEQKDQLLAYLSHEIRNPLTIIVGNAELMHHHSPSLYADNIQRASSDLRLLVEQLLEFSALEMKKLSFHNTPMDPKGVLNDLVAEFAASAKQKGLLLQAEYCEEEVLILADVLRFRQALSNLISNAIKFSDTGHIWVKLARTPKENPRLDQRVWIYVKDEGCGIQQARRERLFHPYFPNRSPVQKGAGLGLAITKQLVEEMSGKITFESEEGRGTTFKIDFPLLMNGSD
ncbi:MAG: HAMP domain-containing sensor histidine kinase [Myxococcota bacterium]|nr:HAMP domain-containing sensor histidine kinase [Myxococcota bacterium]